MRELSPFFVTKTPRDTEAWWRTICSYLSHHQHHPPLLGPSPHCTSSPQAFFQNHSGQQLSNWTVRSRMCSTQQVTEKEWAMESIHCEEKDQKKTSVLGRPNSQHRFRGLGLEWLQVRCTINIGNQCGILKVRSGICRNRRNIGRLTEKVKSLKGCSLCLLLHCCPANKFFGTIFLDSVYMP